MPYLYAKVSAEEHADVKAFAQQKHRSMSAFIRECINRYMADEGDDAPLLVERKWGETGPALRGKKLTPDLIEKMCWLRKRRLTYREISALCGVSESTAHRAVTNESLDL